MICFIQQKRVMAITENKEELLHKWNQEYYSKINDGVTNTWNEKYNVLRKTRCWTRQWDPSTGQLKGYRVTSATKGEQKRGEKNTPTLSRQKVIGKKKDVPSKKPSLPIEKNTVMEEPGTDWVDTHKYRLMNKQEVL